jgi:hypothetical protein
MNYRVSSNIGEMIPFLVLLLIIRFAREDRALELILHCRIYFTNPNGNTSS